MYERKFSTPIFGRCLITKKEPLLRLDCDYNNNFRGRRNVFRQFMDNRRRDCGVSMNNERCRVMLSTTSRHEIYVWFIPIITTVQFAIEIFGRPELENLMAHKKAKGISSLQVIHIKSRVSWITISHLSPAATIIQIAFDRPKVINLSNDMVFCFFSFSFAFDMISLCADKIHRQRWRFCWLFHSDV